MRSKQTCALTLAAFICGLTVAGSTLAQQKPPGQDVVLVDAGWETQSSYGEGVFMVFQATVVPDKIWADFSDTGRNMCNAFSPDIVPKVLELMKKANPAFVSIMLKKGNSVFGSYRRVYYTYEDGKCK